MQLETGVLEDSRCFLFQFLCFKPSTYRSFLILATTSGSRSSQLVRCVSMTPPSKKGDGVSPKSALVNLNVSISDCSFPCQWKRIASRSFFLTRTCRKAFCRSPVTATGLNRPRTSTSHSLFCRGGPAHNRFVQDVEFFTNC